MKTIYSVLIVSLTVLLSGCQKNVMQVQNSPRESVQTISTQLTADSTATTDFLLFLPENYRQQDEWPLMLFLHGAGERGNDVQKVAVHGPPKLARQGKLQQFIIMAPQCPTGDYWNRPDQQTILRNMITTAKKELKVDEDRVYVTGLSMGGYGTWELAASIPGQIAAAAPVCGGGSPEDASALSEVPIWAFHGAKDDVVDPERSKEMVAAIEKAGGDIQFTLYPNANHNSWDQAYDTEELYSWMLEQNLQDRSTD